MSEQQFSSVDEITNHYDKQIKSAGEDELAVANLRAERAERVADFRDREARTAQHRSWVTEAASKHSIPDDLVDLINRPDWTQEQIMKAAEQLAEVRKAPTAAEVYGGSTVGGGTLPKTTKDSEGEFVTQFEQDWNNRVPRSAAEFQRYIQIRAGRHVYAGMKRVGSKHIWDKHPTPESMWERF